MTDTIHRNFKTVEDAEAARAALLDAGFHGSAVQLNLHNASATDATTNAVDNIFQSLTPDDADGTDRATRTRSAALLSVDIDTHSHREQANTILLRFGGTEA
jgi:hypothetical protein